MLTACSTIPSSGPGYSLDESPAYLFGPRVKVRQDVALRAPAPDGFVEMRVTAVLNTEGGPAVVLQDVSEEWIVPIWVGLSEAHAIQLRLERRRFARPLTHDLFETVMTRLGGELIKVQVEELRGDTYVGSIYVRGKNKIAHYDARPSDSIALALGNDVPIFVSRLVIEAVNLKKKDLFTPEASPPDESGKTAEPQALPPGVQTL